MAGFAFSAAGLVAGAYTALCLRDGVLLQRGYRIERRRQPVLYWVLVGLSILLMTGLLTAGVSLVIGRG
jgi:hypothetical protein